ncbi:hypothetical protein OPV22_029812 [Ensete ventricosum]|uniref:Uncharacterized protein n=1 Tax=Ensete ventricosum TaxID=4639 RepID=A0AAV8Q6Y0_ENSVE|nr:hypothetical protein OPV22_029812 [Ensete ventricosum]
MSVTSSDKCLHEAATISTAWVGGGGVGVRPRFAASGPKARVRARPGAGRGHSQSGRCPRENVFLSKHQFPCYRRSPEVQGVVP